MKFTVSEKIQKETSKCLNAFSCLSTGQCGSPPKCDVKSLLCHNTLIVEVKQNDPEHFCPYLLPFGNAHIYGNRHICNCPTHYAIVLQNPRP